MRKSIGVLAVLLSPLAAMSTASAQSCVSGTNFSGFTGCDLGPLSFGAAQLTSGTSSVNANGGSTPLQYGDYRVAFSEVGSGLLNLHFTGAPAPAVYSTSSGLYQQASFNFAGYLALTAATGWQIDAISLIAHQGRVGSTCAYNCGSGTANFSVSVDGATFAAGSRSSSYGISSTAFSASGSRVLGETSALLGFSGFQSGSGVLETRNVYDIVGFAPYRCGSWPNYRTCYEPIYGWVPADYQQSGGFYASAAESFTVQVAYSAVGGAIPVPEPGNLGSLMLLALGGIGYRARRRTRVA